MRLGILGVVIVALVPTAVLAGPRDDVVNALVKCTDITDNAARLACFDRHTAALRAAAHPPPAAAGQAVAAKPAQPAPVVAPEPSAPAAPPPKAVALAKPPAVAMQPAPKPKTPENGGSWLSALNPFAGVGSMPKPTAKQMAYQPIGQEILPIVIAVKDYYVPLGGAFMVTLANGQVWRAVHGYQSPPRFRAGKTNYVAIDHAMLGGYNLSLYGNATLYKVERVR